MIARILISQHLSNRQEAIKKILAENDFKNPHPDLLYLSEGKLGIKESHTVKQFLSLKPYSAKVKIVIIEQAGNLTTDAQNALLKVLEEPPEHSIIILGADSPQQLLETVLSRCQIQVLENQDSPSGNLVFKEIENLEKMSFEERFLIIENLEQKKEFLESLIYFYSNKFHRGEVELKLMQQLLQAERWANQSGNLRTILEYLMLILPEN